MANVNVRINDKIKLEAESIFAKIGLTPTTAINLFYNQVIRTNSIPFELKADIPNKTTLDAIDEVEKMEKNPDDYQTFESVEDLMEDLYKWRTILDVQVNLKRILN